jgi:hypothetical protein
LAPSRERQLAALENKLFQTGREGLSVGATGERPSGAAGLGATTPEREAYYNAIAQQDLELAAKSRKGGMEDILFGTGLFGTGADLYKTAYQGQVAALTPYEAYLGQAKALEALGQQPLGLGIDIGAKGQSTGAAQALLASGTGAAQRLEAANAYNPFANFLTMFSMNPTVGQGISSVFQPYIGAQQAIGQYGAGNVYGFGGGGMAPGPVTSFY